VVGHPHDFDLESLGARGFGELQCPVLYLYEMVYQKELDEL
jgi:hypothetical protein